MQNNVKAEAATKAQAAAPVTSSEAAAPVTSSEAAEAAAIAASEAPAQSAPASIESLAPLAASEAPALLPDAPDAITPDASDIAGPGESFAGEAKPEAPRFLPEAMLRKLYTAAYPLGDASLPFYTTDKHGRMPKPEHITGPHATVGFGERNAAALLISAIANGIAPVAGSIIPRAFTVAGMRGIIERGAGSNVLRSGKAGASPVILSPGDYAPAEQTYTVVTDGLLKLLGSASVARVQAVIAAIEQAAR